MIQKLSNFHQFYAAYHYKVFLLEIGSFYLCDSTSKSKWFSRYGTHHSPPKVIRMNKMLLLFTLSTNIGSVCLLSESPNVVFIEQTDGRVELKASDEMHFKRQELFTFYFYFKWYLGLCWKQRKWFVLCNI